MSNYFAEYIWIDGSKPTPKLRSKTKVVEENRRLPLWGFDGSSTGQAVGEFSDCVLKPVKVFDDPIRGKPHRLVICEVLNVDMTPHVTNTRAACAEVAEKYASYDPLFGLEQEYTFFDGVKPYGWPDNGFPPPQGGYYCGVGADEVFGLDIVNDHMGKMVTAGIKLAGVNAEVMPAQWEFQIGPLPPLDVADQIWVARWLLYRVAAEYDTLSGDRGVTVKLDPKPVPGDWNGAGCHSNFSTKQMRESYDACLAACEALGKRHALHIKNYGAGIELRLTGDHETASHKKFSYAVSNRGCSIRIPWQVNVDQRGYIEDRRPNANVDPYVVTRLITETVCGTDAGDLK